MITISTEIEICMHVVEFFQQAKQLRGKAVYATVSLIVPAHDVRC